jgi:hypothetical protein
MAGDAPVVIPVTLDTAPAEKKVSGMGSVFSKMGQNMAGSLRASAQAALIQLGLEVGKEFFKWQAAASGFGTDANIDTRIAQKVQEELRRKLKEISAVPGARALTAGEIESMGAALAKSSGIINEATSEERLDVYGILAQNETRMKNFDLLFVDTAHVLEDMWRAIGVLKGKGQ